MEKKKEEGKKIVLNDTSIFIVFQNLLSSTNPSFILFSF